MMIPITTYNFAKRFPDLCHDLNEDDIQTFLDALLIQELDSSEALIAEDTMTDSLFLVWEGELNVVLSSSAGEVEIARVGVGEYLGEISLMDPGPATATVRSNEGGVMLHMNRDNLDRFWKEHPQVASAFLHELSRSMIKRIQVANQYLNDLMAKQESSGDPLIEEEASWTALIKVQQVLHETKVKSS